MAVPFLRSAFDGPTKACLQSFCHESGRKNMKFLHSAVAGIVLALAISAESAAEAKPVFCPTPAKMTACPKGWLHVCMKPIFCKLMSGKQKYVCLKWSCMKKIDP
jgi:hypothetical protein